MRADPIIFDAYNRSNAKSPRFVVRIEYPVDSLYVTSHLGIAGVPGTVLGGALEEPSIVSQRLNPIDGRSEIGSASFSIIDRAAEFTSEIRERLSDNEGLRNKKVSFYLGYDGLAFGDYVLVGTQRVTEASFDRGRYSIRCADIQRSAKKDIFSLTETQLALSVSATATTITVTSTAGFTAVKHGASYSDAAGETVGYVKIRDEVIRWTGKTSTTFTGCTRGALGTVAAAYDVDASTPAARREKVAEHVYLELPAVKLAYAILTGTLYGDSATLPSTWHLAIDPALIRFSDFVNIGADLWDGADGGTVIRFEHLKKTDGKKFLEEELCRLLGAYLPVYADGSLGFRRATRVLADAATVATLNETNSVQVGELVHDMDDLHNVFNIDWNWTGSDFTRTTTLIDVNSAAIHGRADPLDLGFKGLYGGRATDGLINQLVDALRDRYAAPPQRISVEVLHSLNRLEVGDVVRVAYSTVRDFAGSGNSIDRSFEIQNISVNHRTGAVSLELFGSTAPASAISPTDAVTAMPDTFYRGPGQTGGAGANLSTVATITGGVMSTGTYTLAGGATLTASGSIWYYDGDLTIPAGTTLIISGNVQLRIRGYLTVNGTINGIGGGNPGTTDGANTTVLSGTPGYVGNSRGRDGIEVSQKSGNPVMATLSAPLTVGKNATFPYLEIRVENGAIVGLPTDLRGTGGAPGGKVQYQNGFRAKGGAGGNGGAGLAVIARGFSTGAGAVIDLSGTDGTVGDYWDDEGKRWNAGGGGAGGPGAFLLLLDGSTVSAPDLTNRLRCRTGIVPTAAPYDDKLKYLEVPGAQRYNLSDRNFAGWPDPAVISGQDLSFAAQRIQFIPAPETPTADPDAAPPALLSLTATAQDGYTLVAWALPVDPASYDAVELWSSITNNRADATLAYDGRSSDFKHITNDTVARYYWARSRKGRVRSGWYPSTTTSTVTVAARPATLTGNLTNESHTVAADAAGVVASFAGAGGTFKVYAGAVDVTSSATFSLVAVSNVSASIGSGGVYAVSAMTADSGTATLRATYAGINLDKVFSITKARAGTNGTNGVDGKRGAGNYFVSVGAAGTGYSISAGDAIAWDGGTLTNAIAQEAAAFVIAASGTGFIEVRDLLTITDPGLRAGQRIYQGARTNNASTVTAADWSSKVTQTIDGSLIVTGTLSADTITTGTLNALRLNVDGLSLTNSGGQLAIKSGGVTTTLLTDGAVTGQKLFAGSVTNDKITNGAIDIAKFASDIRPVEIVSSLPSTGNVEGRTVYLTTDDKLYRWTGSAWTAAVPAADISGALSESQIGAGTITAVKLAAGIEPISVVSSVPGTKSTSTIFNTVDGKLYRWNGSAYVASIPAVDVTGTLSDSQLAAIAAAKITGQIVSTQITDGAISTPKLASGSVTTAVLAADSVVAGKIAAGAVQASALQANSVTSNSIAANSISSSALQSDSVVAGKISAGAVQASALQAGAVTANAVAANSIYAGALQANSVTSNSIAANSISSSALQSNSVVAGKIAAAAVSTTELAARSISAEKLRIGSLDNLISNGNFASGDFGDMRSWSGTWSVVLRNASGVPSGASSTHVAKGVAAGTEASFFTGAKAYFDTDSFLYSVQCKPGEVFYISADAAAQSGTSGTISLYAFHYVAGSGADGSALTYIDSKISSTSWQTLSGRFVVPANVVGFWLYFYGSGLTSGGTIFGSNIRVIRAASGELIVDGAVTAAKLEADLVLASTFKTAGSGYRTEISNSGSYPIWYGTGTKNDANGLFYVKTDGSVFFKGTIGTGSKVESFRVSVSAISGTASGAAGTGDVTSAAASVTTANGTGPFTYLWELVGQIMGVTATVSSSTAAGPTFSGTAVDGNEPSSSIWRVTVTDANGNVAQAQGYVRLIWVDTR